MHRMPVMQRVICKEARMESLYRALESAITNKNWYAALFIALSIPDICGYIESPNH